MSLQHEVFDSAFAGLSLMETHRRITYPITGRPDQHLNANDCCADELVHKSFGYTSVRLGSRRHMGLVVVRGFIEEANVRAITTSHKPSAYVP